MEYIYLILYIFWGWIFTRTVFGNALFVYVSFIFLFVVFGAKTIYNANRLKINTACKLWIPFYAYMAIRFLFEGSIEMFAYWMICLFLVCIASCENISSKIPYKLMFWGGMFAVVGIFIQMFAFGFYTSHIKDLFVNDDLVDKWIETSYGFNGFCCQLDVCAEILVCTEAVVLFLFFFIQSEVTKKTKIIQYSIVILLIISVFLTGKRTNSAVALVLPFLVSFLSSKGGGKKTLILLLGCLFLYFIANYVISNSSSLESSIIFGRFARSLDGGTDSASSGRDYLWERAIQLYHTSPVFGIGPGNYVQMSGNGTDVHNMYIQCLCEVGLLGLILFLVPLLYSAVTTIKLTKSVTDPTRAALLSFSLFCQLSYILEGITENMNVNKSGFIFYAIAIAIMSNIQLKQYDKDTSSF